MSEEKIGKGSIYRHQRGTEYEVVACGHMEATGHPVVVYRSCDTGEIWVRPLGEFLDRFTLISRSTPSDPAEASPPTTYWVYPDGTNVKLPDDSVGFVMGVTIKNGRVSYMVVWWRENKRNEEWMFAEEVDAIHEVPKIGIGFHPPG